MTAAARPFSSAVPRAVEPRLWTWQLAFSALWLFVFSIPWEDAVVIPGFGTISRALGAATLGTYVVYLAEVKRTRRIHCAHVLMVLFAGWSTLTLLWTYSPVWTIERSKSYLQLILVTWVIWDLSRDDNSQIALLRSFVFGTYVSSIDTIYQYLTASSVYYQRYAAKGFDPNELALTLALSIPVAHYLGLRAKGFMPWVYRLAMVLAVVAILLTASRMGLLVLLLALAYIPLTAARMTTGQYVLLAVAAAMMAAAVAAIVPAESWKRISTTQEEISEGNLNSRVDIWRGGLYVLRSHPIAGVGAGAYAYAVEPVLGWWRDGAIVAHNSFISVLVECGFIGLLLFVSLLVVLVLCIWDMPPLVRSLWAVCLLVWAIGVCSLTWEHRKPTWLLFSLIAGESAAYAQTRNRLAARGGSLKISLTDVRGSVGSVRGIRYAGYRNR